MAHSDDSGADFFQNTGNRADGGPPSRRDASSPSPVPIVGQKRNRSGDEPHFAHRPSKSACTDSSISNREFNLGSYRVAHPSPPPPSSDRNDGSSNAANCRFINDLPRNVQKAIQIVREQVDSVAPHTFYSAAAKQPLSAVHSQINRMEVLWNQHYCASQDLAANLQRTEDKCQELTLKMKNLEPKNSQASKYLEELRLHYKTELGNSKKELKENQEELEKTRDELDKTKTVLEKVTKKMAKIAWSDDQGGVERDNFKIRLQEHKAEIERLKGEMENRENILQGNQIAIDLLKAENVQIKSLKEDKDKLRAEIERLKANHKTQVKALKTEKANLKSQANHQQVKIEELQGTEAQLRNLVHECRDEIEKIKAESVEEIRALTNDKTKLQSCIQEQNTKIQQYVDQIAEFEHVIRLMALPSTPVSDSHTMVQTECGLPNLELRGASGSPGPFLKAEAPDPTPLNETTIIGQSPVPIMPTAQRGDLEKGVILVLEKVFQVTAPRHHDLVLGFIERLGSLESTDMPPCNVLNAVRFPGLNTLNLFTASTPPLLMESLEQEFARLCFLIPCLDEETDQPGQYETMAELIASLTNSEHFSPAPALAFLEAMSAIRPNARCEYYTPMKGLIAVMICELCRGLEQNIPHAPKRNWDMATILGDAVADVVVETPVGQLAAALSRPSDTCRSDWPARIVEKLGVSCGDKFCPFVSQEAEQMGLLCSDENSSFAIINFARGEVTVVDCPKADMVQKRKKFDLFVKLDGQHHADEVFRINNAPPNMTAFWVRYAIADDA
ncbi:hypothetical protein QBC44DRAFT_324171 [Cladorrhinum sp. PSN332]|nr:hypothetical protein QBC44DRAFT_324171 [Cladorrhinum sp. PSN332]